MPYINLHVGRTVMRLVASLCFLCVNTDFFLRFHDRVFQRDGLFAASGYPEHGWLQWSCYLQATQDIQGGQSHSSPQGAPNNKVKLVQLLVK